jgi:hypothetical protein
MAATQNLSDNPVVPSKARRSRKRKAHQTNFSRFIVPILHFFKEPRPKEALEEPPPAEEELPAMPATDVQAQAPLSPKRPPAYAATIRPPIRKPKAEPIEDKDKLLAHAKKARIITEPTGATAFEVTINDKVFSDLTCRIILHEGQVVAVFKASDKNACRLLEAEAGRLRNRLEAKGMKVAEVRVELQD